MHKPEQRNKFKKTIGGSNRHQIGHKFNDLLKLTATDNLPYWEVTDRSGIRYLFGQDASSRQDNPNDPTQIFKWCLNHIEDRYGNYVTISYTKDQGQIYLDRIDYTGNTNTLPTTNYIKFYLESRPDVNVSYTTNFKVVTAYRLKTIDVNTNVSNSNPNGIRMKAYDLSYTTSNSTGRSTIVNIQQFGNDVQIDNLGNINFGAQPSSLPSTSFRYTPELSGFAEQMSGPSMYFGTRILDDSRVRLGDFNGDGKTDIAVLEGSGNVPIKIYYANDSGGFTAATGPTVWISAPDENNNDNSARLDLSRIFFGDFNGDGKTDIAVVQLGTNHTDIYLSTGTGFVGPFDGPAIPISAPFDSAVLDISRIRLGDFDGDGKTDFAVIPLGGTLPIQIYYSQLANDLSGTGGFTDAKANGPLVTVRADYDGAVFDVQRFGVADFNGDGKADFMRVGSTGDFKVYLSSSSGYTTIDGPNFTLLTDKDPSGFARIKLGDFNGDGKMDIAIVNGVGQTLPISICYFAGTSFDCNETGPLASIGSGNPQTTQTIVDASRVLVGDFNGDGRSDIAIVNGWNSSAPIQVYLSTGGNGFSSPINGPSRFVGGTLDYALLDISRVKIGDFDGDGKSDFLSVEGWNSTSPMTVNLATNQAVGTKINRVPNLLSLIINGYGAATSIDYSPSTYSGNNPNLIFPVQTVSSITNNDGNGNSATTSYAFGDGFFRIGERDFRGFNSVKVTGPMGPNGEQKITNTWFHQGIETGIVDEFSTHDMLVNLANVSTGYMKGKPYRTRITDASGKKYSETTTIYAPSKAAPYFDPSYPDTNSAPYFNPPYQVDTYTYDANANYTQTQTIYVHDGYGNVNHEYHLGDVNDPTSTDKRIINRFFSPNDTLWIVGRPYREEIYQGTATNPGNMLAATNYYYDDASAPDCSNVSNRKSPNYGKVTRTQRWLHYDYGTNPDTFIEERKAYDALGNLICNQDANGNTTKTVYDNTSNTFPVWVTTPPTPNISSGLTTTTLYYGVDGVSGNGLYGQKQSVTDSNGAATLYEYESLGRKWQQTTADLFQTNWRYLNYGTIGQQLIATQTSDGRWSWSFIDGLMRPFVDYKSGPDNVHFYSISSTVYDVNGNVHIRSMPAFPQDYATAAATPITYAYDALGRVTQKTSYLDATHTAVTLTCYDRNVTVTIDPNGHRRREERDPEGNLVKVEEYTGTFSSCTTDETPPTGMLYATTVYTYDVLGHLLTVTDTKGNFTEMRYDSLGRKRYMNDPDMGIWNYGYDANGNLVTQTDAKNQTISFYYDSLNRLYQKHYNTGPDVPAVPDVVMTFDEVAPNYFNKGHLTTMSDASGTTVYNYDNMGRTASSTKTVNGSPYTLGFAYLNGRLNTVTYPPDNETYPPDKEIVSYGYYNDGSIKTVGNYVTYLNIDALGRPSDAVYGNQASSHYGYDPISKRLSTLTVQSPTVGPLVDNSYGYDNKGNITSITDNLNTVLPTNYTSDTFTPARAHAISTTGSGQQFVYDNNGNMCNNKGYLCSDIQNSISYNFENMPVTMPTSVGNISFVYDGNGTRTIKNTPSGYIHYIDKYIENNSGIISKYIFAGNKRIATKDGNVVLYYHPDHLGSTSVVTNALGGSEEKIAYYPFGEKRQDKQVTGAGIDLPHKYTGQELDGETNYYNYGARLYAPELARFLAPDTVVPDYKNPQSLNKYAYAINNPMKFVDPTGHRPVVIVQYTGAQYGSILYHQNIDGTWSYFIANMQSDSGTRVAPGTYYYQVGTHLYDGGPKLKGFSDNGMSYEALNLFRDPQLTDRSLPSDPSYGRTDVFHGINVHAGEYNRWTDTYPENKTGSTGCHTIPQVNQYSDDLNGKDKETWSYYNQFMKNFSPKETGSYTILDADNPNNGALINYLNSNLQGGYSSAEGVGSSQQIIYPFNQNNTGDPSSTPDTDIE